MPSRPPTNPNATHVDFLDCLRGVAILAVFAFHSLACSFNTPGLPWAGWFRGFNVPRSFLALLPATFGWVGVPIFFVISGFCIHLSFQKGSSSGVCGFYLRRFFRVYPPYLGALLLFGLLLPGTRLQMTSWADCSQLGSHLLLLHNFGEHWFHGINGSFWSIAVEFQLYLLYPILLVIVSKFGWSRALVILAVLEISMRLGAGAFFTATSSELPRWFTVSPFFFWFSWALGARLGEAFLKREPFFLNETSCLVWLLLAVGVYMFKPLSSLSFTLFAVWTATACSRLLSPSGAQLRLPAPIMQQLRITGLWSYSIYLLHEPFVSKVTRIPEKLIGHPVQPLLLFTICLGSWFLIRPVCGFYYKYCEVPSINLGRRVLAAFKPQPAMKADNPVG
jgi:peptidoglycan/LPS O-acetylase OafA/YrhL